MTRQPATAAGRALLADAAIPAWWAITPEDDPVNELWTAILAIEQEAVAAFVWDRSEATPGFNEELAQGLADLEAGKGVPFSTIKREAEAREGLDVERATAAAEKIGLYLICLDPADARFEMSDRDLWGEIAAAYEEQEKP